MPGRHGSAGAKAIQEAEFHAGRAPCPSIGDASQGLARPKSRVGPKPPLCKYRHGVAIFTPRCGEFHSSILPLCGMKHRNISTSIIAARKDPPVVLVNGARQTGKTTLVRELAGKRKATYVTLDDPGMLDAALPDPAGFVDSLGAFAVVDEVQNAPNIFRALKASVDRDRRPGRFLLTGSANVLALPRMGDSLAGRMEIITLHPFAQDELAGRRSTFIDTVFKGRIPLGHAASGDR